MEDEIADGILVVGLALPHLLVVEPGEAAFNALRHVIELADGVVEKERCYLGVHVRSLSAHRSSMPWRDGLRQRPSVSASAGGSAGFGVSGYLLGYVGFVSCEHDAQAFSYAA